MHKFGGPRVMRDALRSALSYDVQARDQFALLPHDQQAQALRRLAAMGHGDHVIANATGLDVQFVRRLLAGDAMIGSVEGENR